MELRVLVKWVWTYLGRLKWMYVLSFAALLLETFGDLSSVWVQRIIIDDVFTEGKYHLLVWALLMLVGAAIIHAVMVIAAPMIFHRNRITLDRWLARDVITYINRDIPIPVFQKERMTKYVDIYTNSMGLWANAVTREVPITFQQLAAVVALLVVIGLASPVLLLALVVFSTLYYVIGRYFAPRLRDISKEVAARRSDLIIRVEEGISATREIVSFHRQRWERAKYKLFFGKYYAEVMKEVKWMNRNMLASEPLRWGARVIVFGYGGYLVMKGEMSIGWFVVVFQFTNQLMDALQLLFKFVMGLAQQLAYGERVLEAISGSRVKRGDTKLLGPVRTLELDRIHFAYGDDLPTVLRNLTIDLPVGFKIALVGESGGGKSTIAQLLLRFHEPRQGALKINGISLSDIADADWHGRLAVVFQEPYLFADTIRHNLLLGRDSVDDERLFELCRVCAIDDVIRSLPDGFDTVLGERGITLSGGQRQRLALVRAIIGDPEILVLDEATSSLDLETERIVQRNLDRIRKGKTTIIIAHRLSTIENADMIYVIADGGLAESGTHDELIARGGTYNRLVHARSVAVV